jgi:ABC-2 type transport system ATP-binding protein
MLDVQGLRKEYGELVAVRDIRFQLHPGDVFGFIGPNGAGKTTTIKMLATLLEPTAGTATLNGIDIVRHPEEVRPLLGYMPDFFGLYEGITVTEYLEFFAAAYRIPKVATRGDYRQCAGADRPDGQKGRLCGDALARDAATLVLGEEPRA